jgi:hypothetical protein
MKIKVQREEAQGKYNAEYDQLKWIDDIMDSKMMIIQTLILLQTQIGCFH